jgi:hypothetical protein
MLRSIYYDAIIQTFSQHPQLGLTSRVPVSDSSGENAGYKQVVSGGK